MTTPAQIEAAEKVLRLKYGVNDSMNVATDALKAAAEVDQKSDRHPSDRMVVENGGGNCPTPPTPAQKAAAKVLLDAFCATDYHESYLVKLANDVLTAAAEVGEPSKECWVNEIYLNNAIAATIERCAQAADSFRYGGYEQIADAIAAAIRALKDEKDEPLTPWEQQYDGDPGP